MFGFIGSLIIGGIIGAIAQSLMGRDVPGGILGNIIVGFIGAWAGSALFGDWGWVVQGFAVFPAVLGGLVVVFLYSLVARNT